MGEYPAASAPDVSMDASSGSDYNKGDPEAASPVAPGGDAAASFGGQAEGGFGCMALTRSILRIAEVVFCLICFSLVAASQTQSLGAALTVNSVAFLLAIGLLGFLYAIAAAVLLFLAILRPNSELTLKLPRPLLIADFIIIILLFGASCAAAPQSCAGYAACNLIAGAAAMGFLGSFCFMADFWLTLIPVIVEI